MKIYESFQLFWEDFFTATPNEHGFRDWQVVKINHTSDTEYTAQRKEGRDELGFQPLIITEANPFLQQTRQTIIKHVPDHVAASFTNHCRNAYYDEFAQRAGSFRPDAFHAFAEYDSWDSFYTAWLEREGKPVFHRNIPLLIDHTPQIEYWTRKQTGQEILPHQRLLVTTYFVSENRFFDFFIKNVSDSQANKINLLTQSRIGLHLDLLYSQESAHART